MKNDKIVSSLSQLGDFLNQFLSTKSENFNEEENKFASLIKKSEIENLLEKGRRPGQRR